MPRVCVATTLLLAAACGGSTAAEPATQGSVVTAAQRRDPPKVASPTAVPPRVESGPPAAALRWIAAASGSSPEMSQVQIEQDIALAVDVFGPGGRVLFGAGRDSPTVQVLAPPGPDQDLLLLTLGDLFAPRGGRDAEYRKPKLRVDGEATASTVLHALRDAVGAPGEPLLLYLAGHGDVADAPKNNRIVLWGGSEITVAELGEVLDEAQRPVRLVATTCFSGGFGELAFHRSDAASGAARTDRCGLFAAPWDLEASGCDPDPDRARQQGYGLHFLNALRGRDRDERPLPIVELDLDGDGAVSLLEAHTRVRLFSEAGDVPTTTSERWLREAAPQAGRMAAVSLPEEERVIEVLRLRLALAGPDGVALTRLETLDRELESLQAGANEAAHDEELAFADAAAALLARWPMLDDPWHPRFAGALQEHRDAIEAHLRDADSYAAYLQARARTDATQAALWAKRLEAAPVERLVRAQDNRALAGRLKAQGGRAWSHYERLLACERSTLAEAPQ